MAIAGRERVGISPTENHRVRHRSLLQKPRQGVLACRGLCAAPYAGRAMRAAKFAQALLYKSILARSAQAVAASPGAGAHAQAALLERSEQVRPRPISASSSPSQTCPLVGRRVIAALETIFGRMARAMRCARGDGLKK
jgi:hypothetical protein